MPTVRAICQDALAEIGVLGEAETMSAGQGALALLRLQNQLDSWAADRLTLSRQLRTTFTLANGATTVTLGPAPSDVVMDRPMFLNHVTYIIPGSSPSVESPGGVAILNDDQYAAITVKGLSTTLPQWCFYQVDLDGVRGTLTFPLAAQSLAMVLYSPEAVGVPASLNTVLTGPSGYAEAFMYQLALRLLSPCGVKAQDVPLLVGPDGFASKSFATLKRPNVMPGLLGVDPAIVRYPLGGSYNVLTNSGG